MTTVWVAAWQFQCCGQKFGVGDTVTWGLVPERSSHLGALIGSRRAQEGAWSESHHGPGDAELQRGRITSLEAVWVAFAPRQGSGGSLEPVPGSAVTRAITRADVWAEPQGNLRFLGWLAELDALEPVSEA